MLVLTRKKGQKLIIDDNIEVIILETRGDTVKIGINAPKSVPIYREEVLIEIQQANKEATQTTSLDAAFNVLGKKRPENTPENSPPLPPSNPTAMTSE